MSRRALPHNLPDTRRRSGVEVRVGLVKDEHLGIVDDGSGERREGLLPPGEVPDRSIEEVRDADPPGGRPDPFVGLGAGTVAEPGSRRDLVVDAGEEERPVGELTHPPDLHGGGRTIEEPDRPCSGLLDTGQDREERRLPAPVLADHGNVPGVDPKVGDIENPVRKTPDPDHVTRSPMAYAAATFTTSPTTNGATPRRTAWKSGSDADQASQATPAR